MIDLGTLGGRFSTAFAMHPSFDRIVGTSTLPGDGVSNAVIWGNDTITNLNTMSATNCGWRYLESATSINPSGGIVGYGIVDSGQRHAFLLTIVPGAVGNLQPVVRFLDLTNGASIGAGTYLRLRVDASDPDGSITNVTLTAYVDQYPIGHTDDLGSFTNAPYITFWRVVNTSRWLYSVSFRARAWDNRGATASASIRTMVVPSPRIISAGFDNGTPNNFRFIVSGSENQHLAVEGSTNQLDWLPLRTNTVLGGQIEFADPLATDFPRRFYRALVVP